MTDWSQRPCFALANKRFAAEAAGSTVAEVRHESRALLAPRVRLALRAAFPGSLTADFPADFLSEAVDTEALARSIGESPALTHKLIDIAVNRQLRARLLASDVDRIDAIIDLLARSRDAL